MDHAVLTGDLLDRLRRRDPQVLAVVIAEHARPLYRAARGMGLPESEAEDLVQDVFTTFLAGLDRFEGRSQIRTWLFGILHRKYMECRRAHVRDADHDSIDQVFESRFAPDGTWSSPPADLHRLFESRQAGAAISACLEGLPALQRSAFVLKEIEDLETEAICNTLGTTATHLGVLMHRARTRLRECLEARGFGRNS